MISKDFQITHFFFLYCHLRVLSGITIKKKPPGFKLGMSLAKLCAGVGRLEEAIY